jgi:endo-1,4-beta-xylanase
MRQLLLPLLVLTITAPLFAADSPIRLPEGISLAEAPDFRSTGNALHGGYQSGDWGDLHDEPVSRVHSADTAIDPWLVQLKAKLRPGAHRGHSGLLIVQARAVETSHESAQAQFRLVIADKAKPFPRVAIGQFSLDRQWREFAMPFTFPRDAGPDEIEAMIDFGYGRQTVELAGLRVVDYGDVPLARLPRTRITYAGHEPDAAWRHEAEARIERIRKGDLDIVVTDAGGRPVANATVRAELRSHAFEFGTAINVEALSQNTPDVAEYRRHILELFNAGSFENAFKWGNWEGDGKSDDYRERTMRELQWMHDNGLAVRGHVMVWPGWRFLPESIKALRGTARQDEIPALVLAHIKDIALATQGRVAEWDVLNEPINNHDLMDLFGRDIMVDWFKQAAEWLPGVPLFLNDWGNHDQVAGADHVREFEAVAHYLRGQGAPIGGIGLQCHIGGVLSPPRDMLATLDRYQETLGLPVRITEFDVNADDAEMQADYTRDFMIAMFSHPSVIGVQMWGFWAGRHWQPGVALYTKDWTERPNGAAYRKLIKETWHTDETGVTDATGRWTNRGFYGRYAVTVTIGDKVFRTEVKHDAGNREPVAITLP